MYFLLHCLPGPVGKKTVVFENVKNILTPDGVVTRLTVLGKGVRNNWICGWIRGFCDKGGSWIIALMMQKPLSRHSRRILKWMWWSGGSSVGI